MNHTIINSVLNPAPNERQVLFPVNHKPYIDLRHKNIEVEKVFTLIIKDLRYLLSKMCTREHRTYILTSYELDEKHSDNMMCEFTCVMCSLTLCVKQFIYYLELETDSDIAKVIGGYNYRQMLRVVYRNTMFECTNHDLEDSINIETNTNDHYSYFKNRLRSATYEDALIVVEDAIVE